MRDVCDLTMPEVKELFKLAGFQGYEITRLEVEKNSGCNCLTVYVESDLEPEDGEDFAEDEIVCLSQNGYENCCDFAVFDVPVNAYVQWALWCGLIEKIDFGFSV